MKSSFSVCWLLLLLSPGWVRPGPPPPRRHHSRCSPSPPGAAQLLPSSRASCPTTNFSLLFFLFSQISSQESIEHRVLFKLTLAMTCRINFLECSALLAAFFIVLITCSSSTRIPTCRHLLNLQAEQILLSSDT